MVGTLTLWGIGRFSSPTIPWSQFSGDHPHTPPMKSEQFTTHKLFKFFLEVYLSLLSLAFFSTHRNKFDKNWVQCPQLNRVYCTCDRYLPEAIDLLRPMKVWKCKKSKIPKFENNFFARNNGHHLGTLSFSISRHRWKERCARRQHVFISRLDSLERKLRKSKRNTCDACTSYNEKKTLFIHSWQPSKRMDIFIGWTNRAWWGHQFDIVTFFPI